jgi:predicted CoA-substrate-specific enzyme activase
MTLYAGIDVGSGYTKAVLLDESGTVRGRGLTHSGADFAAAAARARDEALAAAGVGIGATGDAITAGVATGYGRTNVAFADASRTEIDCHARGAYHHFGKAMTVVDIGGQDNKVIRVDDAGRRIDFTMNRKCAAGTGSFLEEIAFWLKIPLEDFSGLADRSTDPSVTLGSYCTVFAKTEILARIREGVKPEDLARAAIESVARRVLESRLITGMVVLTGGVVAHVPRLRQILADVLHTHVEVPPDPQHTGALGAALAAKQLPRT